jgi:hypothetical protein
MPFTIDGISALYSDCLSIDNPILNFTFYRSMAEEKRSLSPDILIKILKEKGVEIPAEHAEKVINFLYLIADIVVNNTLEQ